MYEEDFVSYETATKLKEVGFNEPCLFFYTGKNAQEGCRWINSSGNLANFNKIDDDWIKFSAPLLWQAQKWLREVKGIEVYIVPRFTSAYEVVGKRLGKTVNKNSYVFASWDIKNPHPTYEAALSAGIDAALDMINRQNN